MGGQKSKKRLTFWHFTLLAAVFIFAALYLFQVNSIVKDRFSLENTDARIVKLREENRALQVLASESNSLSNLKNTGYALELEEVNNISYIEVKSASPLVLGN